VDTNTNKALVVADSINNTAYLVGYLRQRGFQCELARTFGEAVGLVRINHFGLILSPLRLGDRSFLPLARLVRGSTTALFFFHAVEDGCWWLPAVWHGEQCFGSTGLRPREFACALNAAIDEFSCAQRDQATTGLRFLAEIGSNQGRDVPRRPRGESSYAS
jgi:hypothetical protein